MTDKEFNAILDEYLETGVISGDPGILQKMYPAQKEILQAIKKSRARSKYRRSRG